MTDQVLKVNSLNKDFSSHHVIHLLSFELRRGKRLALFAPSGAGKSTLIKILSGLDSPTSGSFELNDPAPVTLFQEPRLFPHLTVEENILLPFRIHRNRLSEELLAAYRCWLQVCELENMTSHYPCQLSGGMKQKTALIRGLLGKPGFAMLDEPFQSIGPAAKQVIIEHIKLTLPELTLLFVTHDLDEIPLLADRVLFFQSNCLTHPVEIKAEEFSSHCSQSLFPAGMYEPSQSVMSTLYR